MFAHCQSWKWPPGMHARLIINWRIILCTQRSTDLVCSSFPSMDLVVYKSCVSLTAPYNLCIYILLSQFNCMVWQTPLHLAAAKGYAQCIQILIEYGACPDIEGLNGLKPAVLARGKKRCERAFEEAREQNLIPLMLRSEEEENIVQGTCS